MVHLKITELKRKSSELIKYPCFGGAKIFPFWAGNSFLHNMIPGHPSWRLFPTPSEKIDAQNGFIFPTCQGEHSEKPLKLNHESFASSAPKNPPTKEKLPRFFVSSFNMEVSLNGGFPQQLWLFLLKMIILGWRLGVPKI